ncbi:hypothetical protein RN001_005227 [Aquatica leii]|uniref:YqaJ viral recombinase domain-containing protein n=1 Tax=Aquatica leii TaxID=1421715 RepID=A0AAN7SPT0_9COLE|nr:hypothetical protein RN001_005227 [Aquatica leii]
MNELDNVDGESISKDTLLQSNYEKWSVERKKRITASNFGKICKLKKTTSMAKTVLVLVFGLLHKAIAISMFELKYAKTVKRSGLIVDQKYAFLACSPDGLVDGNSVLEIKSSDKSGDLSPEQAFESKKIDYCVFANGK